MDPTTRDKTWAAALRLVNEKYVIRTTEVIEAAGLDESQRRTVRRTLYAMEELGWIHHSGKHTDRWVASYGMAELKSEGDSRVARADELRERESDMAEKDVSEIISRLGG